jgi:hypothetical protein
MEKLVNYGLLSDPGKVRDWCNGLADKTPKELAEGVRAAKSHVGSLSLGQFRQMCTYVPPLSERITPSGRLEQKKSSQEKIEYWKNKRKQEIGI